MPKVLSSQFQVLSKFQLVGRLARAAQRDLLLIFALGLFAGSAHAQIVEVAGGGSILESPKNNSASLAYLPPADSGGVYAGGSLQYLSENSRGLNIEGAFRAKEGLYNGFQYFRPILYDANWVYARRFTPKFRGDFLVGAGGESLIFYTKTAFCAYPGGCRTNVNSNHFLVHAGFGLRYRAFHNIFVRPEVHYYYVFNNNEFNSGHVLRAGASIGYAFGEHSEKRRPAPPAAPAAPAPQ